MKAPFSLIILLLLSLAPAWAHAGPIDVIFDIDWTLTYNSRPEVADFEVENVVRVEGKVYRFSDHAVDVVLRLHQSPEFRVSFFSGGDPSRNRHLVEALYAQVNRLAGPGISYEPFRVGDKSLLTEIMAPPEARFPDRFKKDLVKLIPNIDLTNAVLIDDIERFIVASQADNMLWLQETYEDVPRFELLEKIGNLKIPPPTQRAWAIERNKLAWALGVILEAEVTTHGVNSGTFVEQLRKLTHDANGKWIPRSESSQLVLAARGLKAIGLSGTPLARFPQDSLSRCARRLVDP